MSTKIKATWRTVRLGNVCPTVFSGGTPDTRISSYWEGDLPWLSSGETSQTYVTETEKHISESAVQNSSTRLAKAGDIVIATAGQGSTRGQTSMLKIDTYINQSIIALRPDKEKLDPNFLFYNLQLRYPEIRTLSDGTSSRGSITGPLMKDLVLKLPSDLNEQKRIVATLSIFDEKTENNNHIIKTLEEMAQEIFKEWFVNFRFPGHEKAEFIDSPLGQIPKGWEVTNLFEALSVTYGYPFSSALFNEEKNGVPVIRIRNILDGQNPTFTTEQVDEKYFVKDGDILVGMDGTFHLRMWSSGEALLNQRVVRFRPKDDKGWFFGYLALQTPIKQKELSAVGTTVGHLSDKDLKSIYFIVPDQKLKDKFDDFADENYWQVVNLLGENQKLAAMRNLLLPRLMGGKIRV